MSLTKANFEKMLNEKAAALVVQGVDLTGMDNCFEVWKAKQNDLLKPGKAVVFSGFGTWLRKRKLVHEMTQYTTVKSQRP
jgi:hypothetical protein